MPRSKKKDPERLDRRAEIMKAVSDSIKAISAKKAMDWSRETSETIAAEHQLDEAMCDFIDGKVSREEVKAAYKSFANLHVA